MILLLCMLFIYASTILAGTPTPGTQQQQTPQPTQQQPQLPQGFEMPSEEEMQAMNEAIQELPPEAIEQLEELGREIINNMSDEELQELADVFGTTVDELREDAQTPKQQQDTTQKQDQPQEPQPPRQQQKPETTNFISEEEARQLITSAINLLDDLTQKAFTIPSEQNKLTNVMSEIQDIMYYLKVIRDKQHIKRIASQEYKNIIHTLQTLVKHLRTITPRITPLEEEEDESPYHVLGVSPHATQEEIESAFNNLYQQYNPEQVEQSLHNQGASPRKIRIEKREAQLIFNRIQEAYHQLRDPQMRKQMQRKAEARHRKREEEMQQLQMAQEEAVTAITTAVYDNNLIKNLESFLKAYEPQELAKKKQMEEAEKQRRQEQKQREQQRPIPTPGNKLEPRIQPPQKQEPIGMPSPISNQGDIEPLSRSREKDSVQPQQQDRSEKTDTQAPQQQKPSDQQPQDVQQPSKQQQQDQKGQTKTKKAPYTREEKTLDLLQSDMKSFSNAYSRYRQTIDSLTRVSKDIAAARALSHDQYAQIQNITDNLQAFADEARLYQIQDRAERIMRDLGDLDQSQRKTWSEKIAPVINEIQQVATTLQQASQTINNADATIQQDTVVNNMYSTITNITNTISTITHNLQPYTKIVQSQKPFIELYTQRITSLHEQYTNNTPRLEKLSHEINSNIIGQSEDKALQAAQNLNTDIRTIMAPVYATDKHVNLTTLANMLSALQPLTDEQQRQWSNTVQDKHITSLNTLAQSMQQAYETLHNQASKTMQSKDAIKQLMHTLRDMTDQLRTAATITQRVHKDIQQQSQQTTTPTSETST